MKVCTIILCVVFCWDLGGQSSLDFMTDYKDTNTIIINLPGIGFQSYSSSFAPGQVIFDKDNETVLDFQNSISDLNNLNEFLIRADVNTLGLSFKISDFTLMAGHKASYIGSMRYTKELAELTSRGNASFIGQTIEVGPEFNYTHYHEIYLGGHFSLDKIQIGGKVKLLAGNEHASSKSSQISLTTEADVYNIILDNDIDIYSSGLLLYNGIENIELDFDPDVYNPFFGKNKGLAIDFGLSWQLNNQIRLYGMVIDLGSIKWDKRTDHYYKKGQVKYEGVDLLDFISEEGTVSIKDSLYDLLDLERESGISFSEDIPSSWQIGFVCDLHNKSQISAFFGKINYNAFKIAKWKLGYSYPFHRNLIVSADVNGFGKANLNLGAGIELSLGPVIAKARVANITGVFDILSTRYNKIELGLGMKF